MIFVITTCCYISYLFSGMFEYEKDVNRKEVVTNTFSEELKFNKEMITSDNFLPSFDMRSTGNSVSSGYDVYIDEKPG